MATNFRDAAKSLGIKIAGFDAWDSKATSYTSTYDKIKQTDADAVFLGGLICENGAQLIKDKVAVLGPNDGVKLIAPDGFTTQATIDEAGSASAGMYLSVAGQPIDSFQGKAKEFVDGLLAGPLSGKPIDPYAIYGGQAAQVMLDAIAASDGSRSDVISKLFASDVQDGLLGTFTFSEDGDPVAARRYDDGDHGVRGKGQARHRDDDRSEADDGRRRARQDVVRTSLQFAGGHCPPANCGLESHRTCRRRGRACYAPCAHRRS